MLRIIILLFLSSSAFAALTKNEKIFYDLEKAEEYFEKFIQEFDRQYNSEEEKQLRFEAFKTNLHLINKRNANDSAIHGITQFADITKEEFVEQHGCLLQVSKENLHTCNVLTDGDITGDAPDAFDWRDKNAVSRVKNQGQCGSCWAFSITGNLEAQYYLKHNIMQEFSEQQLVDCDVYSMGCEYGAPVIAYQSIKEMGGIQSENDYPYEDIYQKCHFNKTKVVGKVSGCKIFDITDEEKLKIALYKFGPLSVGLDSTSLKTYKGAISDNCIAGMQDHAVLLVGYGREEDQDFWLIKNSWGESFGEKGFAKIKRGVNACNMMVPGTMSTAEIE